MENKEMTFDDVLDALVSARANLKEALGLAELYEQESEKLAAKLQDLACKTKSPDREPEVKIEEPEEEEEEEEEEEKTKFIRPGTLEALILWKLSENTSSPLTFEQLFDALREKEHVKKHQVEYALFRVEKKKCAVQNSDGTWSFRSWKWSDNGYTPLKSRWKMFAEAVNKLPEHKTFHRADVLKYAPREISADTVSKLLGLACKRGYLNRLGRFDYQRDTTLPLIYKAE